MVGIYGNLGEEIGFGYDHVFLHTCIKFSKKHKHKNPKLLKK